MKKPYHKISVILFISVSVVVTSLIGTCSERSGGAAE
ncbi:MAG: hypothetical protein M2R46_04864 [Verrucomicrobia subdivision 3 bacterium]|nr:hypothetical protein [Limisphaerales bacterium]